MGLSIRTLKRKRRLAVTGERNQPMLVAPVRFAWRRPENAEWVDGSRIIDRIPQWEQQADDIEWGEVYEESSQVGQADPWLVVRLFSVYDPLREYPALFKEFASLAPERTAYLAFAAKYGPLSFRRSDELPERLSFWGREHRYLSYAVSLFEALKTGATGDLRALGIKVTPRPDASGESREMVLASAACVGDHFVENLFECSRLKCNAKTIEILHSRIPEEAAVVLVEPDTSPRRIVQLTLATLMAGQLDRNAVRLDLDPNESPLGPGLQMSYKMDSLIGAMWMQLALAVVGNRTFQSCPICGKWWDATDARSHKAVCSNRCRAKQSYERRKATEEEAAERDASS